MDLKCISFQLFTGHQSAVGVSKNQPAKLAAMEAIFETQSNAPLYLFGWVDENNQEVKFGIAIPSLLSYLIGFSADTKVTGLNDIPEDERPPVNIVFQSYHIMVAIGFLLILISVIGVFYWWKGTLFSKKWLLWIFVFSVLLPQIANQLGWMTAEVGRQPWIVYGIMKLRQGISKVVQEGQVWLSLILFTIIYLVHP